MPLKVALRGRDCLLLMDLSTACIGSSNWYNWFGLISLVQVKIGNGTHRFGERKTHSAELSRPEIARKKCRSWQAGIEPKKFDLQQEEEWGTSGKKTLAKIDFPPKCDCSKGNSGMWVLEREKCIGVGWNQGPKSVRKRVGSECEKLGPPCTGGLAPGGEILLCAGAVHSPHILMLSGIGPAASLQRLGIETLRDAPGVGKNLQDHPAVLSAFRWGYNNNNNSNSRKSIIIIIIIITAIVAVVVVVVLIMLSLKQNVKHLGEDGRGRCELNRSCDKEKCEKCERGCYEREWHVEVCVTVWGRGFFGVVCL